MFFDCVYNVIVLPTVTIQTVVGMYLKLWITVSLDNLSLKTSTFIQSQCLSHGGLILHGFNRTLDF